jgi:hypothetical protein
LFWVYVILKLFIFDVDIFLVEKFSPNFVWLLNYKFFILIGTIAGIWLVSKNRHVLLWTLFIIFYPAVILFWRIPFFAFKQRSWVLAFAIVDAIISFFKSAKFTFITTSFFLVSIAIIFGFSNTMVLWLSIVILLIILLVVYIQRLVLVFKPSGIYQIYSKFFSGIRNTLTTSPVYALDESIARLAIESMDQMQVEKWTTNVQSFVLYNRVCLFVAKRLRLYQDSGLNIVSSIIAILLLVVFTVLSFALVNFGLFKINQHFFSSSIVPTFFNFFYYSFNVLLFNPIQDIVATTPTSQVISMTESFFALFLVAVFVSVVLSVRSQKDANELNDLIKDLNEEGTKMEGYIREKYKFNNVEEAMEALQKLKASFTGFIYKITEGIQ